MEENGLPFSMAKLIGKSLAGIETSEEREELRAWVNQDPKNQQVIEDLEDEIMEKNAMESFASIDQENAWEKVRANIHEKNVAGLAVVKNPLWRYAASFAFLCLMAGLMYRLVIVHQGEGLPTTETSEIEEREHDFEQATLLLADGTLLALDEIEDGTISESNGNKVTKQNGQLTYEAAQGDYSEAAFHTITTPRGSQYQVILHDGSKVWLNSASSLQFPSRFSDEERAVILKGEGYFEIAKSPVSDGYRPFKVLVGDIQVEVLGTKFNLMAYDEEVSINTTLLEGEVRVHAGNEHKKIRPGQQAMVKGQIQVIEVDAEAAVAWKNGFIQFDNSDLPSIIRQLERWYKVEFYGEDQIAGKHFSAFISRDTPLSKILEMLELSGNINFKVDGDKIKITDDH